MICNKTLNSIYKSIIENVNKTLLPFKYISFRKNIRYHWVTIPFEKKPLLVEAPYPYYDWFTS